MYQMDEKPETIHLYVVREEPPRPAFVPIILSVVTLSFLLAIGFLTPYQQPVVRTAIRTSAVLLPLKTFTASAQLIPTGIKTFPATCAHGVLAITNGTVISQTIPAGFTIDGVATDTAVFVPAGSANGYGVTTVSAHAVTCGKRGNLPAYSINYTLGAGVYIRNFSAFRGGTDAYAVRVITQQDRQSALATARAELSAHLSALHYPCEEEQFRDVTKVFVTWTCQFVTYHISSLYHVTSVRIQGNSLLVGVWFIARLMPFPGK
jgi:hypothetical protein